jgi:hypothetical protein
MVRVRVGWVAATRDWRLGSALAWRAGNSWVVQGLPGAAVHGGCVVEDGRYQVGVGH